MDMTDDEAIPEILHGKAEDKVLAYDEQLVRNFIEEIRVFPAKLTIMVKGGAKEDIII